MSITRNQLIHVGVEVLALSSVFMILNSKISHLCERIDDLEKIVKEQNDTIKQHEEVILELVVNLNNLRTNNISTQAIKPKIETPKKVVIIATPPEISKIEKKSEEAKVEEIIDDIPTKIEDDKIDDDTSSSVLDKELEEELKDLS